MPSASTAADSQSASGQPFAVVGQLLGADSDAAAGAVVVEDGTIVAVESPAVPARLPPRQVRAAFVAPGFIDLQVNGAFGFEVGDDWAALAAMAVRLPATGVTTFLPTLVSRGEAGDDHY